MSVSNGPATDPVAGIESLQRRFVDVLTRLRDVPFLALQAGIDAERLRAEFDQLMMNGGAFRDYVTRNRLARGRYRKSWSGVCLTSPDGELYSDLSEADNQRELGECRSTPIAAKCPYMVGIVKDLSGHDRPERARIMRIAPGRSLLWHNHVHELGQPLHLLTVQVPIRVPAAFRYCVVRNEEFRWWKRLSPPSAFGSLAETQLAPGDAYIFNSCHYHNVYNDDPSEHRITLMVYLDLRRVHVLQLVERALAQAASQVSSEHASTPDNGWRPWSVPVIDTSDESMTADAGQRSGASSSRTVAQPA